MKRPDLFATGLARGILIRLQGKHIYGGTVPAADVEKRRAKNREARKSRRRNR